MINIQVVHYSPLKDRYKYLSKLDLKHSPNFVTEKDVQSSNFKYTHTKKVFDLREIRYGFNLGVNSRALKYSRVKSVLEGFRLILIGTMIPKFKYITTGSVPKFQRLPKSQLELSAMHLHAIQNGIKSKCEWILVLEDDAILTRKFEPEINFIMESFNLKKMIFINLNSGAGMHRTSSDPIPNTQGIYRVSPISVRCATAYLINKKTAISLIELFHRYGIQDWLPIDVLLQISLQKIRAETYWQDPPLFSQGSEDGSYKSNLR